MLLVFSNGLILNGIRGSLLFVAYFTSFNVIEEHKSQFAHL
jgi:hypothetical protein